MSNKKFTSVIAVGSLLLTLVVAGSAPAVHAQAVSIATVMANADGIYTIPSLPLGAYTLQSTVPGFRTYVQTGNLYTANPLGTFGNAGHNSLRGPGYFGVDPAVGREFDLRERLKFHVRLEAFNLLNHPNFNLPNGNIASSTFGQITTASDPRILQASMKLIF